ncbi:hypothetical protein FIU96_07585 [Marinobacter sp. THAF39]|nr:hypothetical protein FIV08_07655 [Marinobacter sp. THAF197a]QFT50491.1 hypothetical protein FIU96_07585 [Marinobacter sp. THAF39]
MAFTAILQARNCFSKTSETLEWNYPLKCSVLLSQPDRVNGFRQFGDRRFRHRRAILGARPASVKDLIHFLPGVPLRVGVFYDMDRQT